MKVRVLIFDDDESIRSLLKSIISRRGYEIIDFEDPSSSPLNSYEKCECKQNEICTDIIITDIQMPNVNGLDFIKSQRQKGCKVVKILIISGMITSDTVMQAEKLGCICLQKPFSIQKINEILDDFENEINSGRKLIDKNKLT